MILLIDAGNTRAKFSWLASGETQRSTSARSFDYADFAAIVEQLPQAPDRILGSNVAGDTVAHVLEQTCRSLWNLPIGWCSARDGANLLHNPYAQPEQLGSDRWLAMLGVLQKIRERADWLAGAPCILANFGTATTVDTLVRNPPALGTAAAAFLGGLILPGVTLMMESLATGTAQLPLAAGHCVGFPTDTHSAITSGIAAAQGGALLRQWRLARQTCGQEPRVFVAGGSWPGIRQDVCQTLLQAQVDLSLPPEAPQWLDAPVLDGLACLAQQPRVGTGLH